MNRRIATVVAGFAVLAGPQIASGRVLRVGTYKGVAGQDRTIQAAVNAAKPRDWILVAPGDYKTTSSTAPKGHPDFVAGVLIQTPNV